MTLPLGGSERSLSKPSRPAGGGCACVARADADDNMPGNRRPGVLPYAFGDAIAPDCVTASREAKRVATERLGMKPKHVKARCSD
jgi:hypothetical protein